tara:strand:+ start:410 stop:880 length:471 start_codon:yes stop_codon:yes gene_type:complete
MAQEDYDIANGSGAAVRADINQQLDAIVSNNSGSTEPPNTFPYQWWADSSSNKLKMRNGANSAWVIIGTLDTLNLALATLASPNFSGTPTAPTPTSTDNTTRVATTAMVQAAAQLKVDGHTTITTVLNGVSTGDRSIYIDNSGPSGGADGDVWFEY